MMLLSKLNLVRFASVLVVLSCAMISVAQEEAFDDPVVDADLAAAFNQEELMDMLAAEQMAEAGDTQGTVETTTSQTTPGQTSPTGGVSAPDLISADDSDDTSVAFCVKNGLQYTAGDEWSTGCETCMCQDIRGKGNVICFQKKVCTKVRCATTERLVSRPEVDPCCDVCVPIEELCPECPVIDAEDAKAICGSDGVTYPSMCVLTRTNCLENKMVRVANYGGGCEEVDAALKEAVADLSTDTAPTTSATSKDSGMTTGEILITVGLVGLLVLVVCACLLGCVAFVVIRRRKAKKAASLNPRASFYDAGQQLYTDESVLSNMPANQSILMQSRLQMMPTIASVGGNYEEPELKGHPDSELYGEAINEDEDVEGSTFNTSQPAETGSSTGTHSHYTPRESSSSNGPAKGKKGGRSAAQKKVVIRKATKNDESNTNNHSNSQSPPQQYDTKKYGD